VCDSLCILGDGVTLFAKNSDRPVSEPQVVEVAGRRRAGESLPTQYIAVPDAGAFSTLLSRPPWLWGAEHGVNEHRVAVGNELIFTVDDAHRAPPALIGMDLVRLGLERGRTAEEALDAMTALLERHGQGGVGDLVHGLSYWSSFLIADPVSAWVLETSGRRWAARPVSSGAALSNCLTLRHDWTRASADTPPGTDIGAWRHPGIPTAFADGRLAAGRAFVDRAGAPEGSGCDPRAVVGLLRDHGTGPWGAVGGGPAAVPAGPSTGDEGWTVCLHTSEQVTTASMVALLPADRGGPARAWVALGSPCVSVYVPVPVPRPGPSDRPPPPLPVPALVGDVQTWGRFAALGAAATQAGALEAVRAELSVLEEALWDEADGLGTDPGVWEGFGARATRGVTDALDRLEASGIGAVGGPARGDR
jgi:secernin